MGYGLQIIANDILLPTESPFNDPEKHIRIHKLDAEHIGEVISEAIRNGIIIQPRHLPEWRDAGWDELVETIELLMRDDSSSNKRP